MAERIVLCIEPDGATVEMVRRELGPHGFGIENIPNGDEAIEWGRVHPPALIVLSVEPRKVGYAICNKLKRSPSLRDVPLVLVSSEETLATFEQHRKLKSRADEYLLKPLDPKDFASKVDRLLGVGLGDGGSRAGEEEDEIHEIDADSDILIADDEDDISISGVATATGAVTGVDEEEGPLTPPPVAPLSDVTSEQRVLSPEGEESGGGGGSTFEGEKFDPETQAAFAALEAGAAEGPPAGSEMVDLRNLWSDDDLPAALNWESPTAVGKDEAVPADAIRPDLEATSIRPPEDLQRSLDKDLDDPDAYRTGETLGPELLENMGSGAYEAVDSGAVAAAAGAHADLGLAADALDLAPPPGPEHLDDLAFDDVTADGAALRAAALDLPPVPAPDDGRLREATARAAELEARIQSLENERTTLRKELEEARERFTQSATFSKEREFLGLREIINKKEKDILDLRDGMDAKERQILDHKDKIRELERARRDLDEKTLGFERNLVAANEKTTELQQDKDKSLERERALRAKLDDAQEEARKARDEADTLKKRAGQDEVRLRGEMDRQRVELEARLAEIEEGHRQELARTLEERQIAETAASAVREAELLKIDGAHKIELETLQRRLAEEQSSSGDRMATEVGKHRKEHEKAIAALRDEHGVQLASERQAYEASTEQKERDHRNEILGMRRRQEEELTAAEERRQRDITEQEARRVSELEAAESRRRAELQGRDEEQHARITEIERRHLTEKTEMSERHRGEHDQALGRAARAEGELAARAQELEQAYRRLSGLETDIDAARAELGEREVRLAQMREAAAQLEAKVAGYEDQIVRAYQRIRADEKTAEKTRRALAVALALMDERGTQAAAAASAATGASSIAGAAPAGASGASPSGPLSSGTSGPTAIPAPTQTPPPKTATDEA